MNAMSASSGITINLNTFRVTYWMEDGEISHYDCKTLWEAVKKAQALDEKWSTEYGITLMGKGHPKSKETITREFYKIIERYEKFTNCHIDTALCDEIIDFIINK